MRSLFIILLSLALVPVAQAIDLTKATIVYNPKDAPLVGQMARTLADDIERVSGVRPAVATRKGKGEHILLATCRYASRSPKALRGAWERFSIETRGSDLCITGSDPRGLAYGVLHVSEQIGVSPWYWFADVPVLDARIPADDYAEDVLSPQPTIRYRGLFINDEDWGLLTWASRNYEKELGDIGPRTYDRVCELILRLKGNMLAPAMHTCTGAFYSHRESQATADRWGIMITTSHCEPLLFNNAAPSEWDKARDGEWNYETNAPTILRKLSDRIRTTAHYDNIYTMGMRGLHDEAMKGSTEPRDRARTLEEVFRRQREILEKYKKKKATAIPQIFVPYKETLDIYDAGLRVPDDITLVWPDDNYGYMKRVSNAAERRRRGGSGVYYHLSYLGTPHDYLWLPSTAPMLMYEELLKAYEAGADRYWLLNVGDIKPMEIETQMFFDMAYDFSRFSYDNANRYQAQWLASVFGRQHLDDFQFILDHYYRLAWDRKPEFMGYEWEWNTPERERLHDSDFSFADGSAQRRLVEYQDICYVVDRIDQSVKEEQRPALFEMLGYAVQSAYQMNRKFLYAQANHETGLAHYAQQATDAYYELNHLRQWYNTLLDGKWDQMMSEIPPGICARYQLLPEFSAVPTDAYRLPADQRHASLAHKVDLQSLAPQLEGRSAFRLLEGLGTDWVALQMGQPLDAEARGAIDIPLPVGTADSITVCIAVLPMWPVSSDVSNRIGVSVDGSQPVVCENLFKEWGTSWSIQVLANSKEYVLTFPLASRRDHTLTLSIIDPGQIVQRITYE